MMSTMIARRVLVLVLLAVPFAVEAQEPTRVWRVGFLSPSVSPHAIKKLNEN
jgi:hypothetical protein